MEKLRGVVERITYANADKGYSVLKIRCKGYAELIPVVGSMVSVSVGTVVTVCGTWSLNPKYGRQFNAQTWEESLPASVYGLEKYLGSGLIKGIGPKFAKLIVRKFGANSIDIIENEPERLIEVENIGHKRVAAICQAWTEQKEIKNVMIFLQAHDVSTAFGYRIYKQYGNESIDVVKKNPYQLADDIWGIGFQTADTIARKMGMDLESYPRCRAGVFYVLNRLADEGHCFAFFDDLSEKSTEILKIDNGRIVMTIGHLMNEKELISEDSPDGRRVYLPPFFFAESGIAKRIASILRTENVNVPADFDNALNDLQTRTNITYETTQITAIRQAIMSKFSVVTGGPGTGKTTITKAIISLFVAAGKSVLLAAPTGRAAKRLSEVAGLEAKTIHRLLEYKPPEGYGRKAENPLIGDVLILDECSMIDTLLMYNLLKAVPDSMTIVMAGDIDQLPSVGAGNVLGDIMGAKILPVTCLTHIFRQAAGSRIITNAHRINAGKIPDLSSAKNGDFFFIETEKDEALADKIVALCAKRLPKYYRANPVKDIQVMTPMRRGEAGADNLNRALQAALNPATLCLRRGASEYRLGDKVMQIRNNYDKLVFNGDIGIINHVDLEEKTLTVLFDERPIKYDILELDELVLSYAVTVHKSQGGEFPIVIMPVTFKHYALLQRNLLYTGVTRAKKVMVMLGEKSAVAYAVNNAESGKRNTALSERLRKVVR